MAGYFGADEIVEMYWLGPCAFRRRFSPSLDLRIMSAFPANKTPESYVTGNQRPIRRNPLIARTLYYSKDMESFATGLKRIKDACDKAGCRVEFETPDDGFVVVFYRHGTRKLSDTAQKTAQKEERINALLEYCKEPRNRGEMMEFLGIKHRTTFRNDYLNPLLDGGKIAMTIPDKPQSKNQKPIYKRSKRTVEPAKNKHLEEVNEPSVVFGTEYAYDGFGGGKNGYKKVRLLCSRQTKRTKNDAKRTG